MRGGKKADKGQKGGREHGEKKRSGVVRNMKNARKARKLSGLRG